MSNCLLQLKRHRWTYWRLIGGTSFASVADIRYIIHIDNNIERCLSPFSITLIIVCGRWEVSTNLAVFLGCLMKPKCVEWNLRSAFALIIILAKRTTYLLLHSITQRFYLVVMLYHIGTWFLGVGFIVLLHFIYDIERSVNLYTAPLLFIYCEIILQNIVQSLADGVKVVIINPPTLLLHRLQLLHHHSRLLQKR